ncbi:MAG: hypothetical protein RL248_438 [Pseudomonadota bacterium]|jgi:hypothetical protein
MKHSNQPAVIPCSPEGMDVLRNCSVYIKLVDANQNKIT